MGWLSSLTMQNWSQVYLVWLVLCWVFAFSHKDDSAAVSLIGGLAVSVIVPLAIVVILMIVYTLAGVVWFALTGGA